jgi:hypothetical protein
MCLSGEKESSSSSTSAVPKNNNTSSLPAEDTTMKKNKDNNNETQSSSPVIRKRRNKRDRIGTYTLEEQQQTRSTTSTTTKKKRKSTKSKALQRHGKDAPSGGMEALIPSFIGLGVLVFAVMAQRGFRGRASVAGIDLGTTNSVICIQAPSKSVGAIDCVPDPDTGSPIIPSVVAFLEPHERKVGPSSKTPSKLTPHPSYVMVGHRAKQRIDSHPHHTLYNAKRVLGRPSSDEAVKMLQNEVEFKITTTNESDEVVFQVDDDVVIPPHQVGSYVVNHLMQLAKDFLGHDNVHSAVLAVPAKFDPLQRQRTMEAFKNAGITVARVLEEPTAAALAYGLHKKEGVEKILVYDFVSSY